MTEQLRSEPQSAPVARRALLSRWQVWAAIAVVLVIVAVVTSLVRNSDSAKTSAMRSWLADVHKYDSKYDDLGTATYKDGNVTVTASRVWADPVYGGYFLCSWVEPWLRDLGNGTADSQITVIMGGKEVLRSRGHAETCEKAEPPA